jgi:hypothetical protein
MQPETSSDVVTGRLHFLSSFTLIILVDALASAVEVQCCSFQLFRTIMS